MGNQSDGRMKERIEWVDIYKGIAIILVVLGHATGKFNSWIYQFHMAAFFFISGYLSSIEKKNDFSILVKKFLTIMLPLYVLSFFGIILNTIIDKAGYYELLFGEPFIGFGESIAKLIINGQNFIQYLGTLWFLIALFGVELLTCLLYQLNGKKLNILYFLESVGIYGVGQWMVGNEIFTRFELELIFIAQLYYVYGIFIRKRQIDKHIEINHIESVVVLVFSIGMAVWASQNRILVDYPSRSFQHPLAEMIVPLASIFIIIFISKEISIFAKYIKRFLSVCGKNSLGIMTLHFIVFKAVMVVLYLAGKASLEQITNVVMPTELSDLYWIPLTVVSVFVTLFIWQILLKIPVVRVLLGQDDECNKRIVYNVQCNKIINNIGYIITGGINRFWNAFLNLASRYKVLMVSILAIGVLFSIPMMRTGIIINDELRARCLAMQGFDSFYKTEFTGWLKQGRFLAALVNSFTKYLSFIGASYGTSFRIGTIIILLAIVSSFGIMVNKILNNKVFAMLAAIIALACMPIGFEHTLPNAFVGFIGFALMLVFLSISLYIIYLDNQKKSYAILSMILFFIAMMSYEVFITFVILYIMIIFGRTGYKQIKENYPNYAIPIFTALLYLVCYVGFGKMFPSGYEGNVLGIENIFEPLRIICNLFVVCIPGFYVVFPRYQDYKSIYYNLDVCDYVRICLFVVAFAYICLFLLKNKSIQSDSEYNACLGVKHKSIYILFCGLLYMVLPSLPNAVAAMYQGMVGFHGGFLTLPVTFIEYFAAVFVLTCIVWFICKKSYPRFYVIVVLMMCIVVTNIQQMNDIFSKEQNRNFARLEEIENFLQTDIVRGLPQGKYTARDLFLQQNLLAIHDSYWDEYCSKILGEGIQIEKDISDNEMGKIYYDGDDFIVVTSQKIYVFSRNQEDTIRAVRVTDSGYMVHDFTEEPVIDKGFYVYILKNDGKLYSNVGYVPITGYNPDGWLEERSSFAITLGESGVIKGTFYYPGDVKKGQEIRIFIDGKLVKTLPLEEWLEFEISVEPEDSVQLDIECNFKYTDKDSGDIRPIAIVLSELIVE